MDAEQTANPLPNLASGAEPTDAELWAALKQGKVEALGKIYDRHAGLVYGIALRSLRNAQDAEDLTQEIFLQLPKTSYNPKRGSLRTFLAILTRSRSLDGLRSRQRAQASLERWRTGQPQTSTQLPVEQLYQEEQAQEIQAALAQLSQEQQQVLHLAYREGLSQTAIAEQMGSPLGTVKGWARRGLLKLRQNLQDVLEDE